MGQTEVAGWVTLHVEVAVEVGRSVPVEYADSVADAHLLIRVQEAIVLIIAVPVLQWTKVDPEPCFYFIV